jgi:hypothetical protein
MEGPYCIGKGARRLDFVDPGKKKDAADGHPCGQAGDRRGARERSHRTG